MSAPFLKSMRFISWCVCEIASRDPASPSNSQNTDDSSTCGTCCSGSVAIICGVGKKQPNPEFEIGNPESGIRKSAVFSKGENYSFLPRKLVPISLGVMPVRENLFGKNNFPVLGSSTWVRGLTFVTNNFQKCVFYLCSIRSKLCIVKMALWGLRIYPR